MGYPVAARPLLSLIVILVFAIAIVLLYADVTLAHRPLFTHSKANDPESAIRISDPSVSHVIYMELTEDEPDKWLVFHNDEPQQISLLIGVPIGVHERPPQPVVVVFGPGLPDMPDDTRFDPRTGEHTGAIILSSAEPVRSFYEPVTGTKSDIFIDTRVELPQTGTYYGVVYDQRGEEGKLWISVGESEGFSWRDMFRLPGWIKDVRRFHEVDGWPPWAQIALFVLLMVTFVGVAWTKFKK